MARLLDWRRTRRKDDGQKRGVKHDGMKAGNSPLKVIGTKMSNRRELPGGFSNIISTSSKLIEVFMIRHSIRIHGPHRNLPSLERRCSGSFGS